MMMTQCKEAEDGKQRFTLRPLSSGGPVTRGRGSSTDQPLPALCTSEATNVEFDIQNGHSSQLQSSIHPFHQCQHIS